MKNDTYKLLCENWKKHLNELELIEGRLADIKKQYPELSSYIEKMSKGDPSKKNKYLAWMAKQLNATPGRTERELNDVTERLIKLVASFHKNSQRMKKKDINQYKSFSELYRELETVLGKDTQKVKREKEKTQAMKGSSLVYEDEDFFIVRPETKESSCYYGRNTKWCISATENENYFNRYTNEGKVFYMLRNEHISENSDDKKIALVYSVSGQLEEVYDTSDSEVGKDGLYNAIFSNLYRKEAKKIGGGLSDDGYEEVTSLAEDKTEEILENIRKHLKDNHPEYADQSKELEKLGNEFNENSKFIHVEYEEYDEGEYNFRGYGKIEVPYSGEPLEYRQIRQIEDVIKKTLDRNNVYPREIHVEQNQDEYLDVYLDFGEEDTYSQEGGLVSRFKSLLSQLSDEDESLEKAVEDVIDNLEDSGLIQQNTQYSKVRASLAKLENSKWENFNVNLEPGVITIEADLDLQVPYPPKLSSSQQPEQLIRKYLSSKNAKEEFYFNLAMIMDKARKIAMKQLSLPGVNVDPQIVKIPTHTGEFYLGFKSFDAEGDVITGVVKMGFQIKRKDTSKQVLILTRFLDIMDKDFDVLEKVLNSTIEEYLGKQ